MQFCYLHHPALSVWAFATGSQPGHTIIDKNPLQHEALKPRKHSPSPCLLANHITLPGREIQVAGRVITLPQGHHPALNKSLHNMMWQQDCAQSTEEQTKQAKVQKNVENNIHRNIFLQLAKPKENKIKKEM